MVTGQSTAKGEYDQLPKTGPSAILPILAHTAGYRLCCYHSRCGTFCSFYELHAGPSMRPLPRET